jgi:hypothetical protein
LIKVSSSRNRVPGDHRAVHRHVEDRVEDVAGLSYPTSRQSVFLELGNPFPDRNRVDLPQLETTEIGENPRIEERPVSATSLRLEGGRGQVTTLSDLGKSDPSSL